MSGVRRQKTDDRGQSSEVGMRKSERKEGEKIRRWEGERRNEIIVEVRNY